MAIVAGVGHASFKQTHFAIQLPVHHGDAPRALIHMHTNWQTYQWHFLDCMDKAKGIAKEFRSVLHGHPMCCFQPRG